MLEVLDNTSKVSKVEKANNTEIENAIKLSLENENERVIGYFDEGILVSYLVQVMSKRISSWHLAVLGTRSTESWNYKKNGLEYCWANAMQYAESKNIYRLYWSMPTVWARTQYRTINTSDVWPRYDIYIESHIPAGVLPIYDEYKISYGKKLKTHDVVIKQGLLKNEFRKFN
jgi:hypothetical protein